MNEWMGSVLSDLNLWYILSWICRKQNLPAKLNRAGMRKKRKVRQLEGVKEGVTGVAHMFRLVPGVCVWFPLVPVPWAVCLLVPVLCVSSAFCVLCSKLWEVFIIPDWNPSVAIMSCQCHRTTELKPASTMSTVNSISKLIFQREKKGALDVLVTYDLLRMNGNSKHIRQLVQ